MYIIRETFTAKPGQASKLAKLFNETMTNTNENIRVMTDFVGPFNQVVIETEVENLEEYGKRMDEYMKNSDMKEKMKNYFEMYLEGRREIFQLVGVPATTMRGRR
jgi:hypothetical protein